jgi:hypothetical protein
MASLQQKAALGNDATFQGEIEMAILSLASTKLQQVRPANKPDSTYNKEVSHAESILRDPEYWAIRYAKALSARTTLADGRTDATVTSSVAIAFPVMAGLYVNEI